MTHVLRFRLRIKYQHQDTSILTGKKIDGLEVAKSVKERVKKAVDELKKQGVPIYACEINNGKYFDTGNKLEYLKTVVEFALTHTEINGEFRKFLEDLPKH